MSTSGKKRKQRDFESSEEGGETNIHVVVRCRGRSEREVKENSSLIIDTEGVKGKQVELRPRDNSLNNTTYSFDRVFSQAADQSMVFDDTVKPMVEEMLAGYNCSILAYGQTGTGKTYTMSGDMSDTFRVPSEGAGIIPRMLHQLFNTLELRDVDSCVKCSFIELYNEELRDLLSPDDNTRLRLYDSTSRRGQASTVVHGLEEKHIKDAAEGIRALQYGSSKRQVATTNYNDHSSRSHTVFTVTVYAKSTDGIDVEDLVSAGKFNLVDLAGSENIQRSGAENKRAAEAGMINKSLLTLGRVINALVDRSPHIPYRESKLTRLLQDSLGGQTKTCIIATISPTKSSLEETMSTLDYAFRAKNIRNKPQLQFVPKKTLLKDLSTEIEKLKAELISSRQRNGVYLSNDMYEELVAQNESRRVALEEQRAKMETLEGNLRGKAQELFSTLSSFTELRKECEATKAQLAEMKRVLDNSENTLCTTLKSLAQERAVRKAYETTEEKLVEIGDELIGKLHQTTFDVETLQTKDKRQSELLSMNFAVWNESQARVTDVTSAVEQQILHLQEEQQQRVSSFSNRMETFVHQRLQELSLAETRLKDFLGRFNASTEHLLDCEEKSEATIGEAFEEIKGVCAAVQSCVSGSLHLIRQTAETSAADILGEMTRFHIQLHSSYTSLAQQFSSVFEDLATHIVMQRNESESLRRRLYSATNTIALQNADFAKRTQEALDEDRRRAVEDRHNLVTTIVDFVSKQADAQEVRLLDRAEQMRMSLAELDTSLQQAVSEHAQGMDALEKKEVQLLRQTEKSGEQLITKLKDERVKADELNTSIQGVARSIHTKTAEAVDHHLNGLRNQVDTLDRHIDRAKSESASSQEAHAQLVRALSDSVELSFNAMFRQVKSTAQQVQELGEEMGSDTHEVNNQTESLTVLICRPLASLRNDVSKTVFQEYKPTGTTPSTIRYQYPTCLPRTRHPVP